jgi:hypothetical protein
MVPDVGNPEVWVADGLAASGGIHFRSTPFDSAAAQRPNHGGIHSLELDDRSQHHFSDACSVFAIRFLSTGGPEMLRIMSSSGHHESGHSRHTHHDHHA